MSAYPKLLEELQAAILSGDTSKAALAYRDKRDFPARTQLAVYADGYRIRLRNVVEADFPALLHHLGAQNFRRLVRDYVEATPSPYYNIDLYPLAFAQFIERSVTDRFAVELATLESTIVKVYLGEESAALAPDWLSTLAPEDLAGLSLLPRIASRLMACEFPVNRYLSAFRAEKKPKRPKPESSFLLVYRHLNEVRRLDMEREEFLLLQRLATGVMLGEALEDSTLFDEATVEAMVPRLSGWFRKWLENGVLRQLES